MVAAERHKGSIVAAESHEFRVPQMPIRRPLHELDLGNQGRP
jgi:hypothetical protein